MKKNTIASFHQEEVDKILENTTYLSSTELLKSMKSGDDISSTCLRLIEEAETLLAQATENAYPVSSPVSGQQDTVSNENTSLQAALQKSYGNRLIGFSNLFSSMRNLINSGRFDDYYVKANDLFSRLMVFFTNSEVDIADSSKLQGSAENEPDDMEKLLHGK